MKLEARKSIKMNSIIIPATLNIEQENSEDIIWLLQNYNNDQIFNDGEKRNLINYLKNDLNLLNNNNSLNSDAKMIIDGQSNVFLPEHGIYRLTIMNFSPYRNNEIVKYSRISKTSSKDYYDELTNFTDFQNKEHLIWNSSYKERVRIDFIKFENVDTPKYSLSHDSTCNITIEALEDKCIMKFNAPSENLNYEINLYTFNLNLNLTNLLNEWDEDHQAILTGFDELSSQEKDNFVTQMKFDNESLYFDHDEIIDDFNIELADIPLIPRDYEVAIDWFNYHLKRKLKNITTLLRNDDLQYVIRDLYRNISIFNRFENLDEEIYSENRYSHIMSDEQERMLRIGNLLNPGGIAR
ncbi:MAG: hypothetical protein INQ03_10710 [Candidatus Heimdallarchaeota archaeon]|nr:hypothetical protein [Candidatus Heimdallarchaeota archaeon]